MAYSQEEKEQIFNTIFDLIENGKSLRYALKNVSLSSKTFYEWIDEDDEKVKQYARVTELRAEALLDEMFDIVDKTIKILRENNICDRFDIIFEERENKHSHVWIIPRYAWMNEICDRIIKNIGTILDYAKKNFRTRDVYEQISQITKIVKKNFASKKYN